MKSYYFKLQLLMTNRQISALGVNPFAGYLLFFIIFLAGSVLLFEKTEFAPLIYVFIAVNLLLSFNKGARNNFLETCFERKNYLRIRLYENIIIASPFTIFLLSKGNYQAAIILSAFAGISVLIRSGINFNLTIPTPFYNRPFEFITGFRSTILIFPVIIFLLYQAARVANFNLGIFALLLTFIIILSYYFNVEDRYYVWIYKDPPIKFLKKKIKTGLIYASVLTIPICIVCMMINVSFLPAIIAIQIIGYLYLITVILSKYSAFPDQLSIPHGLLLAFSLCLPLLLFYTIPLFYRRSIRSLNQILL